jgi:cholesterol transport system auxiliary component
MTIHRHHDTMRAILFAAVCLLTGCLARPHLDQQSFIFAPPPPAAPKLAAGARVLGLRTVQVAAPFAGRAFVYRTGEFSYDRDPYAEFMVSPADGLVSPVGGWLREAGVFSAVAEAGSALKPDTLVEIQVGQLYGDFRPSANAAAVLAVRFNFIDAPGGVPGKAILQREYSRTIPLKARTAAALIEGWNQALAQILDSAMVDFGHVVTNAPKR